MAGGKALGGAAKKAVQRAVQQVVKHDWGQLYFNEAVDPVALGIPDYPAVRPRPPPSPPLETAPKGGEVLAGDSLPAGRPPARALVARQRQDADSTAAPRALRSAPFPGVPQVVTRPMELNTVQDKLKRGTYASVRGVMEDVALVWANCYLFNNPGDEVYRAAQELEAAWEDACAKLGVGKFLEEEEAAGRAVAEKGPGTNQGSTPKKAGAAGKPKKGKAKGKVPALEKQMKLAAKVVKELIKMPEAEPFRQPVDPEALGLPDYFDVISRPMDLGTIEENLKAGPVIGWANLPYKSLVDVRQAIELVWGNCRTYNNTDADAWIRGYVDVLEVRRQGLWEEHGLDWIERAVLGLESEGEEEGGEPAAVKRKAEASAEKPKPPPKKPRTDEPPKERKPVVPLQHRPELKVAVESWKPTIPGRCPICKIQKKGSCGSDQSPRRCLRRKYKNLPYQEIDWDLAPGYKPAAAPAAKRAPPKKKGPLTGEEKARHEAELARNKVEAAVEELYAMEDALHALDRVQKELTETDRADEETRLAVTKVVPSTYRPPPITFPPPFMASGNYFFGPGAAGAHVGLPLVQPEEIEAAVAALRQRQEQRAA